MRSQFPECLPSLVGSVGDILFASKLPVNKVTKTLEGIRKLNWGISMWVHPLSCQRGEAWKQALPFSRETV